MATVYIRGLGKDHTDARGQVTRVLGEVSLEIPDGELLVLVGPSGCGKSTLLRCVAGLETVTRGSIFIDGKNMTSVEPRDRDIAMVFQSYALYPHLTVRQNLAFGLQMRKVPADEIATKVADAAAMLGLGQLLDRRPGQLSGGQRQRVAMGRAVVRRPKVFLFDEPLSNLDASLRGKMRVELMQLHRRLAATMLYVTHDQVEAMTLADRIAVLHLGAVQQIGKPDELYRRPANLFVARFLGSPEMNVLLAADAAALTELPDGATHVGVRAEGISVGSGVPALVEVVEHLGWEALVHLRIGSSTVVARVEAAAAPPLGSTVPIAFDPGQVHFFGSDGSRVA